MKTLLDYIRILLLSVGGMLVSCTVLIVMSEQSNGAIAGKQSWIFFSLVWFALSVLFVVVSREGKIPFSFSWPDGLVVALLTTLLVSYPWQADPAPDKLTIAILLAVFWFLLRIVLVTYPFLFSFFLFIYIFTGGVEAVWGLLQAVHWINDGYIAERITGSFYSREAYGGYLAMMLPLCLSMSCYYRNCKKKQWWRVTTLLYYTASAASVLIIVALVFSGGRTVWMAALVSSVWVVWKRLSFSRRIQEKWKLPATGFNALTLGAFLVLLAAAGCIGFVKNRHMEEKMPVWEATTAAAAEQPLLGTGMGSFPDRVAQIMPVPENEVRYSSFYPEFAVTGAPLYASNEYLQLWMEHGLLGLLLFLSLLGVCFYRGLKNKQWGACGALLSLAVFSLVSYPLQIPTFLVTLTFFLVICLVDYNQIIPSRVFYVYDAEPAAPGSDKEARKSFLKNITVIFFTLLLTAGTYGILLMNKQIYRRVETAAASRQPIDRESYPRFGHYPEFYCEYAQDLHEAHCYRASAQLLEKALGYCRHPALYDILAKNLQATGHYQQAEKCLLQVIREHPGRLNSYYLLAKLYSEPAYYQPEKMKQMARTVLNNNKVIYTPLNQQMEKEMQQLLRTGHPNGRKKNW